MNRPSLVTVKNIAPNNSQIQNAQFIRAAQQQPIIRTQTTAFPISLTPNAGVNSSFVVPRNDQVQMFVMPQTGQPSILQLQTQQPLQQAQQQLAQQTQAQNRPIQAVKPINAIMGGQMIILSSNSTVLNSTRPTYVQDQLQQQLQLTPTSTPTQRLPALAPSPVQGNMAALSSSQQQAQQLAAKSQSLLVLQTQQQLQQQQQITNLQNKPQQQFQPTVIATSITNNQSSGQPVTNASVMSNVRKCKNFLSTLLKLATKQSQEGTSKNVYELIQKLVDGLVNPEQFTVQLQKELKSNPQPELIPFLEKTLPYLRQCMILNRMQIDGIRPPPTTLRSAIGIASGTVTAPANVSLSIAGISNAASFVTNSNATASLLLVNPSTAPVHGGAIASQTTNSLQTQIRPMAPVTAQQQQQQQQTQIRLQQQLAMLSNSNNNLTSQTNDNKQQQQQQRFIAPSNAASIIRNNLRNNQQIQLPQQSLNRMLSQQLIQQQQQQQPQQLLAAMHTNNNFIAPTAPLPSSLPRLIISANSNLLPSNQASSSDASSSNLTQNNLTSISASAQVASSSVPTAQTHRGEKRKYETMRDDDDINDLATMGGVNLNEETRIILADTSQLSSGQMRSCKEEMFLDPQLLMAKVQSIAHKKGLTSVNSDVLSILSHAARERLSNLLERLSLLAGHRLQLYKNDSNFIVTNEVKRQMKFRQDLARLEGERVKEIESKAMIKAAKSRTKSDDPEQMKKKELAKKQQLQEQEDRYKEQSNITALAAIGNRRKLNVFSSNSSSSNLGLLNVTGGSSNSLLHNSGQVLPLRPRSKRVTLRDMMYVMQTDKHLRGSSLFCKICYNI